MRSCAFGYIKEVSNDGTWSNLHMLSVPGANSCIPYGSWNPLPRGIPDCLVAEDLPEAVEVVLLLLRVCCEALYHHPLLFLPGKDMLLRGTTITAGCKLKGAWKSRLGFHELYLGRKCGIIPGIQAYTSVHTSHPPAPTTVLLDPFPMRLV